MRVLNLSLDPHLLDAESVASLRAREYGKIVTSYTVIVPTPGKLKTTLSDTVVVHGSGGINKIVRLYNIYTLINAILSKKEKIDVISVQDPYFLGLLALFMARRYHLGMEVHILGLEKLTSFRLRIARFVFRRTSVVRVNSKNLYERLQTEFGVPKERITLAPIYVDVDKIGLGMRTFSAEEHREFETLSKNFKDTYDAYFNFLTVSRLVPIKRITLQLQAIERLKKKYPNIMLHIVGSGPLRDTLTAEINSRQLQEHVILHGAKYGPELGVFYVHTDCFLLTSESEGWGMVITEAATAGLPIIMTDVGCAGEFIVHEKSGMVLPVYDNVDVLVSSMEQIITDSNVRNSLVEHAFLALKALPDLEHILVLYKKSWELALEHRL